MVMGLIGKTFVKWLVAAAADLVFAKAKSTFFKSSQPKESRKVERSI